MTLYILFTLGVIVGAVILAHYMGREIGREQEFNRMTSKRYPCPECRVLTDYASIPHIQERSRS